jgi:hypothetical protein
MRAIHLFVLTISRNDSLFCARKRKFLGQKTAFQRRIAFSYAGNDCSGPGISFSATGIADSGMKKAFSGAQLFDTPLAPASSRERQSLSPLFTRPR